MGSVLEISLIHSLEYIPRLFELSSKFRQKVSARASEGSSLGRVGQAHPSEWDRHTRADQDVRSERDELLAPSGARPSHRARRDPCPERDATLVPS